MRLRTFLVLLRNVEQLVAFATLAIQKEIKTRERTHVSSITTARSFRSGLRADIIELEPNGFCTWQRNKTLERLFCGCVA